MPPRTKKSTTETPTATGDPVVDTVALIDHRRSQQTGRGEAPVPSNPDVDETGHGDND